MALSVVLVDHTEPLGDAPSGNSPSQILQDLQSI